MERFPLSQGEPLSSILGTVSYFACNFSIHSETTPKRQETQKIRQGHDCSIQWALQEQKFFSIVRLTVQVLTVLEVLISSATVLVRHPFAERGAYCSTGQQQSEWVKVQSWAMRAC